MPERMPKKKPILTPEIEGGEFEIRSLKSEKEEIQTILSELQKELDSRQPPNDILVLFHSRKIGRKYVETMLSNDLNVKNLLDRPHTVPKAVLLLYEMLRLLEDESDNLAARFLLKELFNQDVSWISKRRRVSQERSISLRQSVIANTNTPQTILSWAKKLEKWRHQMDNVVEILIELASMTGIDENSDIKKIIEWSAEQESITIHKIVDWLERGFDFEEPESKETEEGCVIKVMTMHGAKGIDADVVFIPALEDELMPDQWCEPEQRRLLYVSMTRAKKKLLLSWAWSRKGSATYRSTKRAEIKRNRSRFLEDIIR